MTDEFELDEVLEEEEGDSEEEEPEAPAPVPSSGPVYERGEGGKLVIVSD